MTTSLRSRRAMPATTRLTAILAVSLYLTPFHTTQAAEYALPGPERALIGVSGERVLVSQDTFASVGREEGVGYNELRRANPGVDPWLPGAGTVIKVPRTLLLPSAPRAGIVINLGELRLFWYDPDKGIVRVYPIGIGSEGRETPLMQTTIVSKLQKPTWYPPDSIRARHAANGKPLPRTVPPGPDNPLGEYALQLARRGYFIHGTNQPMGVGRRISSGCIRMYDSHIEAIATQVSNGTSVSVIREPYKVAWHNGALYLEAHSPAKDSNDFTGAVKQVVRATTDRPAEVNWQLVFETARAEQGVPVRISD